MTLRADPRSARAARRFVSATLGRWKCDHVVDMVSLLTSELVANAVLHAGSPVVVTVTLSPTAVRVDVADTGPGRPERRNVPVQSTSGRGLALVDSMAARWGVAESRPGKSVWFEVHT